MNASTAVGFGTFSPVHSLPSSQRGTANAMESTPVAVLGRRRTSIDGHGGRRGRRKGPPVRIPAAGPDIVAHRDRTRARRTDATDRPTLRDRRVAKRIDPGPLAVRVALAGDAGRD